MSLTTFNNSVLFSGVTSDYIKTRINFKKNVKINFYPVLLNFWGHAVAQLVEALRYKSEGRGLDSRRCHWNFS